MSRIKKILLAIIAAVLILVGIEGLRSGYALGVAHYTVESAKLPASFDGMRIIQLSDYHSEQFGSDNIRLLEKIRAEEPDIVVLTGDMVSSWETDYSTFYQLATALAQEYPVYFIVGNHEQMLDDLEGFLTGLKACGVTVLDNEGITLTRGEDSIRLYGMWYHLMFYRDLSIGSPHYFETEDMEKILGPGDPDKFQLVLTHNPVYFSSYAEWGADLILCGHMHGGVVRIPFIGGLVSPEKVFFPEYDAGMYREGTHTMIVSRGLGQSEVGFRFFNSPEIVSITLKCAPQ